MAEIRLDFTRPTLLPKLPENSPEWLRGLLKAVQDISDRTYADMNYLGVVAQSITANDIANLAITAALIANNTITANQLANNTITAAQIANNTITAAQIVNNTLTANQIANTTITAAQIANLTITANQIANKTISATQIANLAITATLIANNTITANQIANNTLTANQIANLAITAAQIANLTITANQIANLTISANQIASNAVITEKVADDNITRMWTFESDSDADFAQNNFYDITNEAHPIAYTDPFTADATYDYIIWAFSFGRIGDFDNVTDNVNVDVAVLEAIDIVLDGTLKWTKSGFDTNSWYLTNEAGTASGLPYTTKPDCLCDYATDGGGYYCAEDTLPIVLGSGYTEWDFGNYETPSLGFNTVYVRVEGDADPNGKADGWLRVGYLIDSYPTIYLNGYMASDSLNRVKWNNSFNCIHTTSSTHKKSIMLAARWTLIEGGLASSYAYVDRIRIIVLERKR